MLTSGYQRISIAAGATSAITILVLGTAEIQAIITGITIPPGVRHWLIWGVLAGLVVGSTSLGLHALRQVLRGQAALHQRLNDIDKLLDAGGGMRGLIRSELHEALTTGEITEAVERAFAPQLNAAHDYRQIREKLAHEQLATVHHIPHHSN